MSSNCQISTCSTKLGYGSRTRRCQGWCQGCIYLFQVGKIDDHFGRMPIGDILQNLHVLGLPLLTQSHISNLIRQVICFIIVVVGNLTRPAVRNEFREEIVDM